jgi:hypothetical protein
VRCMTGTLDGQPTQLMILYTPVEYRIYQYLRTPRGYRAIDSGSRAHPEGIVQRLWILPTQRVCR